MSVEYYLGDHLGSTSITTDSSGAKVSELRYKPFGEVRYAWTSAPVTTPSYSLSRFTYTGQYTHMDDPTTAGVTEGFGLMFYNARWYDPALGRFAQADTIVPAGVQGLDRYAYVNNSPMNFTDPSGHICVEDDGGSDVGMPGNCGGGSNPNYKGGLQGSPSGWADNADNTDIEVEDCPQALIRCLPTPTPTPIPHDQTQSTPYVYRKDFSFDFEFNIDWTQVDGIDFMIDIAGITGDIAIWTGVGVPYYGGTEIAEVGGLIKSIGDLTMGDPTNMMYNETERATRNILELGFGGGKLIPFVGFIFNLGSMYLNLKPDIQLKISYK
jgi:RHS repeat-associated protein